jgi:hypothetical protein
MPSVVGVTLNQPSSISAEDAQVERFAVLYESEKSGGAPAPFQDVPLAPVKKPAESPRLDLATSSEAGGTRLTAELTKPVTDQTGTTRLISQQVSVLLSDVDAYAATTGLAAVLEASSETNTQAVSDDALATRLYGELQALLDDLNTLFDDLDLVLFPALPDDETLPDLDQYDFSDPYFERFCQLTWASWSGERPYDQETMFGLGLRSSSVLQLAIDFNRRIMDSVVSADAKSDAAEGDTN